MEEEVMNISTQHSVFTSLAGQLDPLRFCPHVDLIKSLSKSKYRIFNHFIFIIIFYVADNAKIEIRKLYAQNRTYCNMSYSIVKL